MLNPFLTFRLCEKISVDAYEPAKFMGEFTSWYFYLLLIYAGEFVILFRESNTDFFEIIFHRCVCLRTRSLQFWVDKSLLRADFGVGLIILRV